MVRAALLEIEQQRLEHLRPVHVPPAQLPRQPAQRALAEKRRDASRQHRSRVQIRDVREPEDHLTPTSKLTQAKTV